VAKQLNLTDVEMDVAQLRNILVDGLGGDIDPMEVVKQLSSRLFPREDLEAKAIMSKMGKEVEEMVKKQKGVSVEDYYIQDDTFEFYFDFDNSTYFVDLHSYLLEFMNFLLDKYKVNVYFNYRVSDYKNYQQEAAKKEKVEMKKKPESPAIFDIEFSEAV
jgi:hypothetical protein